MKLRMATAGVKQESHTYYRDKSQITDKLKSCSASKTKHICTNTKY